MTEPTTPDIKGYTAVTDKKRELVNHNKQTEEMVLRVIDLLKFNETYINEFDQEAIKLAEMKIKEGFMWLNRGIFQPERIKLDGDDKVVNA